MRARTILTLVLAVFIIAALVTIATQAKRSAPANDTSTVASERPVAAPVHPPKMATQNGAAAPISASSAVGTASHASSDTAVGGKPALAAPSSSTSQREIPPSHIRKVVATYFHGNIRCVTCRKIEAYAHEAVQDAFDEQIAAGTVEFRAVNVDEDANRHFIQDYRLVTRTLVVTEEVDGAVARWARLDNVWGLVGDRTAFFRLEQDRPGGERADRCRDRRRHREPVQAIGPPAVRRCA